MPINFTQKEGINYISNFYRYKLYNAKQKQYLLTTDDGNFIFLNSPSLRQLKKGTITNKDLFQLLENKGFIITNNNFNKIVQKLKLRYSFLENKTSLHIVIPTHRCNLSCIYCFASSCPMSAPKEQKDMTKETAIEITNFILKSPSNAITIEFQGGEPTARFDIIQTIVQKAKELNKSYKKDLRFRLVSNFTLLDESMVDWFIDNDVTFCTSLDGPDYVHDKNRFIDIKYSINAPKTSIKTTQNNIGTHNKVTYWINQINNKYKQKNIKLKVNAIITITKNSLPYHKEIIDEYMKYNINMLSIRALTLVGNATQNPQNINYSQKEFIKFYEKSINYIKELNKQKNININENMLEQFKIKTILNTPTFDTDNESPCGATTGQILYYIDGNIYTCNEAIGKEEFLLGNVFNNKWQYIFKKKETAKAILNSMLENNVKCDRCVYKPYCSTCMVENFSKDKKFNFYPNKTQRHHNTIYHCQKIFDEILDKAKNNL